MTNPYRGLPTTNFWSSAVAAAPPGGVDPVLGSKFRIGAEDRVSTMGSCFAQHISRFLDRVGLDYFVAEQAPEGTPASEAAAMNYGVFSARYGNVYTVRQARQLFDRAFGAFTPVDDVWQHGESLVDAFRPQIEPNGFSSAAELMDARELHFDAVRRIFTESDVIVFTLGLTESWESLVDGAVYPVAPGVHGGSYDPTMYRFVNYSAADVIADLSEFVAAVHEVNPAARVLLTVSPVPLIATYETRHVLVSNTISKATLRVAAAEVVQAHHLVEYFPSYEIISGSAAGAHYFEPDLRQVSQRGVDHVMRVFAAHMLEVPTRAPTTMPDFGAARTRVQDEPERVVCDEELIEATLEGSGFKHPSR